MRPSSPPPADPLAGPVGDWLKQLKKDDEVVTTGGLWGKVKGVSDNSPYVTLELQEKVRVRVLRSHIASKAPANEGSGPAEQKTA